jgi:hypothetical protein
MVHLPSTPSHKKMRDEGERGEFLYTSFELAALERRGDGGRASSGSRARGTCSVNIALLRRKYEKPINVSARIEASGPLTGAAKKRKRVRACANARTLRVMNE